MYRQYVVGFPAVASGLAADWFGSQKSGTANTVAITALRVIADYPRSLEFNITGSSVGMAGTVDVNGRDQFGSVITETMGFGSADNGGTVAGTKVFAQFTSGTIRYGTFAGVNGTAHLGVGTAGTTALFGLPDKLGGTTDVKALTLSTGTGAVSVGGGTIAAYVNVPMSAVQAPLNLVGTMILSVLYKPTFDATNISVVANLPQRT